MQRHACNTGGRTCRWLSLKTCNAFALDCRWQTLKTHTVIALDQCQANANLHAVLAERRKVLARLREFANSMPSPTYRCKPRLDYMKSDFYWSSVKALRAPTKWSEAVNEEINWESLAVTGFSFSASVASAPNVHRPVSNSSTKSRRTVLKSSQWSSFDCAGKKINYGRWHRTAAAPQPPCACPLTSVHLSMLMQLQEQLDDSEKSYHDLAPSARHRVFLRRSRHAACRNKC